MNKKLKKIISLMLISLMVLSFSSTVFATQEGSLKEETVYVMLNESGTSKAIYVVNSYENHMEGDFVDFGEYETVRNLSTLDSMKIENKIVTAKIPKGKFYYEGKMSKVQIPWNIDIIYKLDKRPITAQQLAGKQGKLEIEINLSQNQNFGSEFYENYALQIATSLDINKCSNIIAQGSNISSIGENKNISFTMLPNKQATYKISADVTNFEMGAISIGGVPFSMDLNLDGINDMSSGLTELTDGIARLNNGALELEKGASELKDGMIELGDKSGDLPHGSSGILNAITQINNAVSKVDDLTSPTGGISQLKNASTQYRSNVKNLASKFQTFPESSQAIYDGIKKSANGLSSITKEDNAMETLLSDLTLMNDPNVNTLIIAYKTKMQAVTSIATGLSTLQSQYSSFNEGMDEMAEATQSLSNGYTQIHAGIENINIAINDLATLTEAMNTLEVQYKQFNNGLVGYTDGYKKIVSGYKSVFSGISNITKGTSELSNNTKNLDSEIENTLNEFSNTEYQPISFTSNKNTNIASVQFVMKTDAIKIEPKAVVIDEQPQKLSFWKKLLALF